METVEVFVVGDSKREKFDHMRREGRNIAYLGVVSKRMHRIPPEDTESMRIRFKKARMHLQWLDTSLDITPEIKAKMRMEPIIKMIFDDPEYHYPDDMKVKAELLYTKWTTENWGADDVVEDDIAVGDQEPPPPATDETDITVSSLPPADHPIFGEEGIMYGIMIIRSSKGRKTYRLNPRIPQKPAKVFGHNDIPVGTWFANQLVALHRGAHGSRMGGIAGSIDAGAYSIVVSDIYEDLDDDRGDTLFYSGSNSHNNTDPTQPASSSNGTRALKSSLRTGHAVRVLRSGGSSASHRNRWLPDCGLRYDGLYRVVRKRLQTNTKGGLYEQFELRREPGQPSLERLCRTSPTSEQRMTLQAIQRD
ncbi:PUA-like domain-containing protein [Xylariaceae sp. FL0662B]|nr:PUA-like domain-containing protein [Xylariaceae sp. FL0662B]